MEIGHAFRSDFALYTHNRNHCCKSRDAKNTVRIPTVFFFFPEARWTVALIYLWLKI